MTALVEERSSKATSATVSSWPIPVFQNQKVSIALKTNPSPRSLGQGKLGCKAQQLKFTDVAHECRAAQAQRQPIIQYCIHLGVFLTSQ